MRMPTTATWWMAMEISTYWIWEMLAQRTVQHKIMACTTINAKILLRRDTASSWSIINPVLAQGEPGFETDTEKLKIGDGVTPWNDLGYIGIADSNLIFSDIGNDTRQLTEYKENNEVYTVRSANLNGNMFNIVLASFTPTLSANSIPLSPLNWDETCTGFTVNVGNPDDFPSKYISSVASITTVDGFTALNTFATAGPTPAPGGGVDWTQSFTTDGDSHIYSDSNTINGGNASTTISFNATPGGLYSQTLPLSILWLTPSLGINAANLSGQTFLTTYASTTYSLAVTNMLNPANYVHDVTAVGGTVSNPLGNGTFTFTTPVHKDNTGITRTVSTTTRFTRPISVTGTSYFVDLSAGPDGFTTTFTYPSFWLLKPPLTNPPTPPALNEIVSGSSFIVTTLGDRQRTVAQYVTNSTSVIQTFWFGLLSTLVQPTVFKAGGNPINASDFIPFVDSVVLYPTPTPSGYNPVTYTLYGINVQAGTVLYVGIS